MLSSPACRKCGLISIVGIILFLCYHRLVVFQPLVIHIPVPSLQRKSNANQTTFLEAQTNKASEKSRLSLRDAFQSNTGLSLGITNTSHITNVSTWSRSTGSYGHHQGQEKTVVIGIGSGRSGTLSFAAFFNQQTDSAITHEWNKCNGMHWNEATFANAKARYDSYMARRGAFVGDVALWNLPYVEYFLRFPNVKVVALKRVKNDTVRSFEKWFKKQNRHFPWITDAERDLTSYRHFKAYDSCYPKYQFPSSQPSIAEGASIYWEDYYSQVEKLKEKYPNRIKTIDLYEMLNDDKIKVDVLNWIGMKPPFNLIIPLTHPTRKKSEIQDAKLTF